MDLGELSKKKVYENTWWCYYCCCMGQGCGDMSPLVLGDVKQLCIHSQSSTRDFGGDEGLCASINTQMCITTQCSFPPAKHTGTIMLCGKKLVGTPKSDGPELKSEIYEMEDVMQKPCWLMYCFFFGTGCNMPSNAPGNCCAAQSKFLCCAQAQLCEDAVVDSVCCSQLGTFLCLWNECSLPPAKGNPFIAICGWKKNKDHSEADDKPPPKPVKKEMVVP